MQRYLIKNCTVVNEGKSSVQDILVENGRISKIGPSLSRKAQAQEIHAEGLHLLPGVIDDQVHFREPGLTHKADLYTEAKAAVAGGVTSFMEMPNTVPPAFTHELLEDKYRLAAQKALTNYSFYMGTSNDNIEEVLKTNRHKKDICGLKIFLGSSTGGLLVDNYQTLDTVFRESELLITTHCEDEKVIRSNYESLKKNKPDLGAEDHPVVRDELACYESSLMTVELARKYQTRLHILHLSTARELDLFTNSIPLSQKRITAEVCVHHLHFTSNDYADKGYLIKCNPAIKAPTHREALWKALLDDRLDVIATDHAPHTLAEKGYRREPNGKLMPIPPGQEGFLPYEKTHAGLPLIQHPLLLMLHYVKEGKITLERVVEKMSHAVATCFQMRDRGFIREGYYADLVLVDLNQPSSVRPDNLLYKCGWSPLEGFHFPATITHTFVSGHLVYQQGQWDESQKGLRMEFNR